MGMEVSIALLPFVIIYLSILKKNELGLVSRAFSVKANNKPHFFRVLNF